MNALEMTAKTEDAIIKVINDSGLPLTTIHYMLSDIQRQIVEILNQEPQQTTAKGNKSEE